MNGVCNHVITKEMKIIFPTPPIPFMSILLPLTMLCRAKCLRRYSCCYPVWVVGEIAWEIFLRKSSSLSGC